jgi:Glycosyl hydrolase family 115/Gylcosyl hydrolase family 115 C-terminal domain
MQRTLVPTALVVFLVSFCAAGDAQLTPLLELDHTASQAAFPVAAKGKAAAIYVAPGNPETVRVAAAAFAGDVEQVTGVRPRILTSLRGALPANLIIAGVLGKSPEMDKLRAAHRLVTTAVDGKWEAAETVTILNPPASVLPGVRLALVVAGSDRRGTAYALFALSRAMGVSPWTWWADVPVAKHAAVYVQPGMHVQDSPSVQYRGIFFNDEDWGLRPWAAKKMDPTVDNGKGNIGPHTYERVFELLLRLHANSLWPAMHPGSLAFNAVAENAKLADKWGIVMGSSHSEALLRNNVGEWSEAAVPKGDGPWNYQTNSAAMNAYWDKRLVENGKFENFYTVGLRGLHDSGLEAEGTPEVKARLVEDAMAEQRKLLAARVNADVSKVPQVVWLYKESLDLYRVGTKVPEDVTLGWTDDNYGYIRELPNAAEQKRAGGSGVYYHVSYWGAPHDYLWLCTTPPALLQEELTKAYDHNARKYWILNVGDLKPAEIDIDYFMQLASDEPRMVKLSQREFLTQWFGEQFGTEHAAATADVMTRYYALNFVRKPEFMGFNGYNDGIQRTNFNPLAWGAAGEPDQNRARVASWKKLREDESAIAKSVPEQSSSAFFELVDYPVEGAAAMNEKFLATDLSYLDAARLDADAMKTDAVRAQAAYDTIQTLTAKYNSLEGGKWDGMMSDAPRARHVFEMPRKAADADAKTSLPASWGADDSPAIAHPAAHPAGFHEERATVSINAAHFSRRFDGVGAWWHVLADLGISGDSVMYGVPGLLANASHTSGEPAQPWMEYDFTTRTTEQPATLALHMLPTFAVDSDHRLRYAVALDGGAPVELDLSASAMPRKSAGAGDGPSDSGWAENVLRNSAVATVPLGTLAAGKHTLRLIYRDPGVVFEHIVITFPAAPPAYPVPPETK